jgi:hypothetical protein
VSCCLSHDPRLFDSSVIYSVEKLLLSEGHNVQDIKGVRWRTSDKAALSGISRISSKRTHSRSLRYNDCLSLYTGWNKVRREVIPQVLAAKRWRLNDALRARRKVVDDGITDVLYAHRAPSTWAYSPVREIANFPEFTVLTSNEDEEVVLVPNDVRLVAALAQLPAKLDAWCISQQGTLASRIPVAPGSLELATTVFTCGREHTCTEHFYRPQCCLVGWRAAGAARGYSCEVSRLRFSEPASAAASALVSLVGLDPHNATAEQMDGLDQRFVCNDCPIQHRGREVMTWRVCVRIEFSPTLV